MTTFNEFQKELRDRNIEPQNAYIFSLIYERLVDTNRTVEEMAKMMIHFANTMAKIVVMNQADQQALAEVTKKVGVAMQTPGVEVKSVAPDPNDKE